MSSQDIRRHVWDQLRQKDLRAFRALLPVELVLVAARIADPATFRPHPRPRP